MKERRVVMLPGEMSLDEALDMVAEWALDHADKQGLLQEFQLEAEKLNVEERESYGQ